MALDRAQVARRPVAVIGAGTLGRRIALMLATRGGEVRLDSAQAGKLERLKFSLMPEGLLNTLTPVETSDLLAYLQSLK